MGKLFFTNGNILDVVNERIFQGSILTEDGVIIAVGGDLAAPADAETVDLKGGFVRSWKGWKTAGSRCSPASPLSAT